jgi:hypothetical protein
MAISPIEHVTSPNPTTTIEATILTIYVAHKTILPLSQLPPKFDLSQTQPFNQLKGRVTCSQLNFLGYVLFQVFEFITHVDYPRKNLLNNCCNIKAGFAKPTPN